MALANRQLVFPELETRYNVHFGRYLGRGGFGEVYEAHVNGVACAIKVSLDPVDSLDGAKEIAALELVKQLPAHPYIVSMFDDWVVHGYLVTRWELGQQSLADQLRERRSQGNTGIERELLFRHVKQAAEALDYLNHERGIFHRDIKPENLILFSGHVKVADLGLAKFKGASTGQHSIAGTLDYMSPEAADGRLSRTSDLYSLAATYLTLRTGRSPFGATIDEVVTRRKESNPTSMVCIRQRNTFCARFYSSRRRLERMGRQWNGRGIWKRTLHASLSGSGFRIIKPRPAVSCLVRRERSDGHSAWYRQAKDNEARREGRRKSEHFIVPLNSGNRARRDPGKGRRCRVTVSLEGNMPDAQESDRMSTLPTTSKAVTRRAVCLNWARTDPWERQGAIPGATRHLTSSHRQMHDGRDCELDR
jgi:serine/threonine protein kinase